MRVAVISDIHANYHALEAVLAAIDRESPDEIWCLGDLVGYGPRPNRCCRRVAARATLSLVGNHDLGATGALSLEMFSPDAAAACRWTRSVLKPDALEFLAGRRPMLRRKDAELYHASPRDPVWDYVLSEQVALISILETTAPLVLVGHSHVALGIGWDDAELTGGLAPEGTELDVTARRWLLNPGSVGQPRDGDPRAAWLLVDDVARRAVFRRVPYPIAETQAAIRERGLPSVLASRLAHGI
jgi:predicted phosphodiesterase